MRTGANTCSVESGYGSILIAVIKEKNYYMKIFHEDYDAFESHVFRICFLLSNRFGGVKRLRTDNAFDSFRRFSMLFSTFFQIFFAKLFDCVLSRVTQNI